MSDEKENIKKFNTLKAQYRDASKVLRKYAEKEMAWQNISVCFTCLIIPVISLIVISFMFFGLASFLSHKFNTHFLWNIWLPWALICNCTLFFLAYKKHKGGIKAYAFLALIPISLLLFIEPLLIPKINFFVFAALALLYLIALSIATFVYIFEYDEYRDKIRIQNKIDNISQEMHDFVNPIKMYEHLGIDVIKILVGQDLLPIADPDMEGQLLLQIANLRHKLADNMGYIIPNVRTMDNNKIKSNEYQIYIRNKMVFSGFVMFASNGAETIISSLEECCFKYVDKIMTYKDAWLLCELVESGSCEKDKNSGLTNELLRFLSISDLWKILTDLIREKISIKDIMLIFERLARYAKTTQDCNKLTEMLKKDLL